MKPSVIVWDLETVPDLAGFAAANDLVGKSDVEVREASVLWRSSTLFQLFCSSRPEIIQEFGGRTDPTDPQSVASPSASNVEKLPLRFIDVV
jgi:hypothetical protein